MSTLFVHAIGLAAPGLPNWAEGKNTLSGAQPHVRAELPLYQPQLLPPNERRRATPAVRQAFRAAEDAVQGRDPSVLASVFSGSDADMAILHRVCLALLESKPMVSPTDFHNSVHNAAAGYWSIAVGARAPSSTLAGYDGSFALGLIEAAGQVQECDTLLVVFDVPAPEPLLSARPLTSAASCALVLSKNAGDAPLARLSLRLAQEDETVMEDATLEALRLSNPALRALPLLALLARGVSGRVVLPGSGGQNLRVKIEPA